MKYSEVHKEFVRNNRELSTKELTVLFNDQFQTNQSETAIRGLRERSGASKYKKHVYTDEQIAFLKEHSHLEYEELTKIFNRQFNANHSVHRIAAYVHNHSFREKRIRKHFHTEDEIKFILENRNLPRKDLAELFNSTFDCATTQNSIEKILHRNGGTTNRSVCINESQVEFFNSNFKKMRNDVFAQQFNKVYGTSFPSHTLRTYANNKLGLKKSTTDTKEVMPQYTITLRKNCGGRKRKYIKTSKVGEKPMYVTLEKFIYERFHDVDTTWKPIIHLDGDIDNFDIDNLCCLTFSEMASAKMILGNKLIIDRDKSVTITAIELARLMITLKETKNDNP